MSVIESHGLWSNEQRAAANEVQRACESGSLDTLRLSFADQHGVLRGKTLVTDECASVFRSGCSITSTLLLKDTSHRTVFPVFTPGVGMGLKALEGGADILMVPDPTTFRVLPWAPRTGWMLCDLYFQDGRPVPFSTRGAHKAALAKLRERGMEHVSGLEVELHIFKLVDPMLGATSVAQPPEPPEVSLISHGYQYLTEQRYDQIEPILEILRAGILDLKLPLRSIEVEFGPSQCEFTFKPESGLTSADNMVLFRSAVKQICSRHGYHATFMCRPKLPNVVASGWHLHQSLISADDGTNLFVPQDEETPLSSLGMAYVGGLLTHARASSLFSTPTINGFKRYRSYSLAPDRANWGRDNRGVMLRVLGGLNDVASRVENRIGEPLANPYLYMASQLLAGLDGIDATHDPGPSADTPYETDAPLLPRSLREAVIALKEDKFFRGALSPELVDYYIHIKEAEIARFQESVTDWEHREYFGDF